MDDHLQEGDGGDAHIFEVLRVVLPGFCLLHYVKLGLVIVVKGVAGGVNELDGVLKLWSWLVLILMG